MHPALREAASRVAARVVGSRFAKPIVRVVLATAGLLLLAFIGKTAVAGAMSSPAALAATSAIAVAVAPAVPAPPPSMPAPLFAAAPAAMSGSPASEASPGPATHTRATADDPVILNTATIDDLRRLPGVGEKKATAIVALRTRLGGRLHAVEDLLKVKGIGRATLRRLRPLVRLDPLPVAPAVPDAGAGESLR